MKPENLLLDENGNLKVSDFGLSAVTQQLRQDGLLHSTCGTPAYVAPEVITRKGYDGSKADLWSCGVILFVLMAGYLPFHDANLMVMYKKRSPPAQLYEVMASKTKIYFASCIQTWALSLMKYCSLGEFMKCWVVFFHRGMNASLLGRILG